MLRGILLPLTMCLVMLPALLWAQTSVVEEVEEDSPFGLYTKTSINSSLHSPSDIDYSASMDFALYPSFKISETQTLSLGFFANKDIQNEREFTLDDYYLSLSSSLRKFDSFDLAFSTILYMPLSESTIKDKKKRFGIGVAPVISLNTKFLGLKKWSISLTPRLIYNVHEFETSLKGKSNTQYSISQSVYAIYTISDILSLSLFGRYSRYFTYGGNQKDAYQLSQQINLTIAPKVGIFFGHIIGGAPLNSSKDETSVELFDSRESTIYTGASYNF